MELRVTYRPAIVFRKGLPAILSLELLALLAGLGMGAPVPEGVTGPQKRAVASKPAPSASQAKERSQMAKPAAAVHMTVAKSGGKKEDASRYAGLRDPFKMPPPPAPASGVVPSGGGNGPLPPGVRGLIIRQLQVRGIVRMDATNSMIAVVTNASNLAYFLHQDEALYNGVVAKITPDAVTFRENILDQNGRVQTQEVVKRIGQAPER
jgi:hypothetical protein